MRMKPRNILIKCDPESEFLRYEALSKAIEYEEQFLGLNKNPVTWNKQGTHNRWLITVSHTDENIIAVVEQIVKIEE